MTRFTIARENSNFWDWIQDNREEHPCPSAAFGWWLERATFGEFFDLPEAEAYEVRRWIEANPWDDPCPVDISE